MSKSERARTPVVPRRNDVLKQSSLQSFKTRRCNFAMDGKITPTRRRSESQNVNTSPLLLCRAFQAYASPRF
ncbi:hypothetical protein DWQ65_01890 [Treponema phagedenis]|uniref:Uncharacterized protein n=1 Tax=Treponema phagedenis TaxID=162 RepID=A0AAE6IRB4_TREPH|nr:hypothetical protein FUT79_01260 [Treponema phagedenis]QEJ96755.1 hypothetical protein FUT82_01190 [Treponema phagedenis]QEJ96826.1 hypothetical protein FUT82_01725 [Treponema phagedenis]QEJ96915.1 hypothetical protein FUT82_02240 [Treponema phagedenis]QEJ97014.1 hypothetical protein FUT82_02780 [Treponema phagedenis]